MHSATQVATDDLRLLGTLQAGVASIPTTSCGIAPDPTRREAALVIDESPSQLIVAIDRLLSKTQISSELAGRAHARVRNLFGNEAVVDNFELITRKPLLGCEGHVDPRPTASLTGLQETARESA